MGNILVIGSGRSTYSLIKYLKEYTESNGGLLTVVDKEITGISKHFLPTEHLRLKTTDILNEDEREAEISNADIVVSMLPASMHTLVAKSCIKHKKNMVTASYISKELKELEPEVKAAGITIINEIGVDPGIDHLSAKKVIDELKSKQQELIGFETFTGGLVSPEFDNNPWNYKFTWNPQNVVTAGQGGAVKFIQEGTYKYIPYHKLFRRTELIDIEGYGKFEGYANRDSLKYRSVYGLENIKTMYRGTLRRPGFCRAWNCFIELGATDNTYIIPDSEKMTYREFINLFLPYNPHDSVELKLRHYLNLAHDEIELFEKFEWLDLFKDIPLGIKNATPARALQHILEQKWKLLEGEKDMIVMWHKFTYKGVDNNFKEKHSSMVVIGKSKEETAMAMTVGLPAAIATKFVLEGMINDPGIHIPISKEYYGPILSELKAYGIHFKESQIL